MTLPGEPQTPLPKQHGEAEAKIEIREAENVSAQSGEGSAQALDDRELKQETESPVLRMSTRRTKGV